MSIDDMAKIVSIANQKGGVGKTLFTRMIAHYASEKRNKKVLVIDFDSQAHSTISLIPDWRERGGRPDDTSALITGARPVRDTITSGPRYEGGGLIDVVVSSNKLVDEEIMFSYAAPGKGLILRDILYSAIDVMEDYDYIIIDNGPGPMLQRLSIAASDAVLVPMEPTQLSALSTEGVIADMVMLARRYGAGPSVIGYVINLYEPSKNRMQCMYELTASDLGKDGFILGPIRKRRAYDDWEAGTDLSKTRWRSEIKREFTQIMDAICNRIDACPHQDAKHDIQRQSEVNIESLIG